MITVLMQRFNRLLCINCRQLKFVSIMHEKNGVRKNEEALTTFTGYFLIVLF